MFEKILALSAYFIAHEYLFVFYAATVTHHITGLLLWVVMEEATIIIHIPLCADMR
jgi:hypothetical protein